MKTTRSHNLNSNKVINNNLLLVFKTLSVPFICLSFFLSIFSVATVQASSLSSLSGLTDVLEQYTEQSKNKIQQKNKSRRVASRGEKGDYMKTGLRQTVKKNCRRTITDYGKVIEDCIVDESELLAEEQANHEHGQNCNSMRTGSHYPTAKAHKVKIMGDGKLLNAQGKVDIEDDREVCRKDDLACKASGTFWCEDKDGDLVQAGSATVVDGEMVYDPSTRKFSYTKFPELSNGQVRVIYSGHNLFDKRRVHNKEKDIKFPGDCYFYPKGSEPKNVISGNQETFKKENFRKYEVVYRSKLIRHTENMVPGEFSRDKQWNVGVLERDITLGKAPIISLPRQLLQSLSDRGASIKQYGYNKEKKFRTVTVAKRNTKLYALRNPSFVNAQYKHTVLDCNDTNGGASGGASVIRLKDENNNWVEAVYAVRGGWIQPLGHEDPGPGAICDPTVYANFSRLIGDQFYSAIKNQR